MSKQFTPNAAAQAAFSQFATIVGGASAALVAALRKAGFTTRESAREQAMIWVGAQMGVAIVESQSAFNKGEAAFDRTSPKFEGAKTALRRLMDTAFEPAAAAAPSNKRAPAPVRARTVKAVADTVVSAIIEAGLTKAELAALIEAVKAGVSFK